LNLITILGSGTEAEKQRASQSMNNYNLTEASIASVTLPDSSHTGATTMNTENTLEKYQAQLEKLLHLYSIEQRSSQSKASLQAESDNEADGRQPDDSRNPEDDTCAQHAVSTVVNNTSISLSDTNNVTATCSFSDLTQPKTIIGHKHQPQHKYPIAK
jgi:hypothetical protein